MFGYSVLCGHGRPVGDSGEHFVSLSEPPAAPWGLISLRQIDPPSSRVPSTTLRRSDRSRHSPKGAPCRSLRFRFAIRGHWLRRFAHFVRIERRRANSFFIELLPGVRKVCKAGWHFFSGVNFTFFCERPNVFRERFWGKLLFSESFDRRENDSPKMPLSAAACQIPEPEGS